ncbi:MAG: hypothetical protein JSV89_02275 [Spirochaetaceae bacterium]|nr:MAG: hypothetical protein JSV89_02275 [Spirochaetaceae bacterium]
MKQKRMGTILTVALILRVAANVLSAVIRNVLSVEAGYAYILSARDVNPDSPHSLLFNMIRQPGREGYAFGHHTLYY